MLLVKFFSSFNDKDQETPWLQNPWRKDAVASFRENKALDHSMHM